MDKYKELLSLQNVNVDTGGKRASNNLILCIAFFFAYVLPLLMLARSEQLEHRHTLERRADQELADKAQASMDEKLEFIISQLGRIEEHLPVSSFSYVKRRVWLTEEKKYSGKRICQLNAQDSLEIISVDGKWVLVKVVNNDECELNVGWLLKKYTIRN